MALVTAANVRSYVAPDLSGTAEDTFIETLITGFEALAAAYCGYPPATAGATPTMEDTSYVRYYTGDGTRDLRLDLWPVVSIASIYDDPDLDFDDAADLVAAADYGSGAFAGSTGLVRLTSTATHGTWSTTPGAIKATYTAGFTTPPSDLILACKIGVKKVWDMSREQGKLSQSAGGGSVSYRDEDLLPREAREVLKRLRLPRVYL